MRPSVLPFVAGVFAAALVLRIAGLGIEWLPRTLLIAEVLAVVHLADALSRPGRFSKLKHMVRENTFGLGLAALVLVAFAVRRFGLGSDLGHAPLDIDEQRLASSVQNYFATGHLQYETVENYPGLVFWWFSAASFVSFVWRLGGGMVTPPNELPIELFVSAARMSNVLVAVVTVAVTALIARRMAGSAAGLVAGGLVAIAPLAVETTTVVRNDAGMVLAVVTTVLLALHGFDRKHAGWFAAAGALAGVATGIKYSSLFAIVPVLLALTTFKSGRQRLMSGMLALGGFVVAIAATNHFVWADFPNFLRQLTDQVAITGAGHWAASRNPAAFHIMILNRFGPGAGLLLVAGGLATYVLATRRGDWWIVISFPVLYVSFMTQRPSQLPRWVYPTVPFVAILGASALALFVGGVRSWAIGRGGMARRAMTGVAAVTVIAVLIQPVWSGVVLFSRRVMPPTHSRAEGWIREHAAPGAVVLLERGWLDLSRTNLQTRRVDNLGETLSGGIDALSGCQWVIVPEVYFNYPLLKALGLSQRIHAGQGFGGSLGYDYEIYSVPQH